MSTDIDQQRTKLRPLFAWLEEVLTERFGVQIQLSIQEQQVRMAVNDSLNAIVFTLDIATFSQARSDLPCRTWDAASEGWQAPLGKPLPAPGVDNIPCPLIEKREDDYHIGYDILGFTYWMLSRQEASLTGCCRDRKRWGGMIWMFIAVFRRPRLTHLCTAISSDRLWMSGCIYWDK
jgi:hypothetical protein